MSKHRLQWLRLIVLVVAAVWLSLFAPAVTVWAAGEHDSGSHDSGGGGHDSGSHDGGSGGGSHDSGSHDSGGGGGGGGSKEGSTNGFDRNGDVRGDINSSEPGVSGPHTGEMGRGSMGDDKTVSAGTGAAATGGVTGRTGPTSHHEAAFAPGGVGGGAGGGPAGVAALGGGEHEGGGAGAAGPGAGAAGLGAGPGGPGVGPIVAGAQQQAQLPFGGLTGPMAFLIFRGKLIGGALTFLGAALLLVGRVRRVA